MCRIHLLMESVDLRLFFACFLLSVGTNFFEAFSASYPSSANHSFHTFFNNSYIDRGHSAGVGHLVLKCFWSLSLHVAPIGNLIGCLIGPIYTENLVGSLISIVSIIFEFPELLILARLVASASATVGLLALVLFLQEIPLSAQRGLYSFLCALSVSIVECFALCLNLALPQLGEQLLVLVGLPLVPQIVALLTAFYLMETPQFLAIVAKNKQEKALKALAFYRKGFSGTNLRAELEAVCCCCCTPQSSAEDYPQFNWRKIWCQLFARNERRKAVLIGFCTLQITVGGWPVLESSTEILSEHFSTSVVEPISYVLVAVYFLSSLTGLFFVEMLNRRPLIIRSALLNIGFLCLYITSHWASKHLAIWLGWLCLPCIFLFAISLGFALGPLSYFICAELLPHPSPHSSWLISLVFAANIISTYIFDWATPLIFRKASAWAFVPLYIVPSLCCLVPLWLFLPETRGQQMHDIVNMLKSRGTMHQRTKHQQQQKESSEKSRPHPTWPNTCRGAQLSLVACGAFIDQLVARLGIDAIHLCAETPTKWRLRLDDPHWKYPKGVVQRNAALRWLRKNGAHQHVGAVYFGDDDNTYDWRLFDEIRLLKRVGTWPVGIVGGMLAEFAYVNANAVVSGFNAKWKPSRPFPIDMAAFAVNISLIHEHAGAEFSYKSPRGFLESHFLSALNLTRTDLEPLAKNGTRVYVWHTRTAQAQLRAKQIAKFYSANVSTLAEAEKDAIS
ncbi:hypothetical protein niasHS_008658 [Heterodera schachtii]|uniref:Galactosylgalactosylxylosylprotein 3-beta-glucuronosyltransferase n=1 Tax=Heterodera schachtii TaxID=97005 RepID=A0ABD2J9U8_HETSC